MARVVYHVLPEGDDWKVRRAGAGRAEGVYENKSDAVERAKVLAKGARLGQVKIHKQDGSIQTEHTYGEDPRRYKG